MKQQVIAWRTLQVDNESETHIRHDGNKAHNPPTKSARVCGTSRWAMERHRTCRITRNHTLDPENKQENAHISTATI